MPQQEINNLAAASEVRQRLNENFTELYERVDAAFTSQGGWLDQGANISLHNGSRILAGNTAPDEDGNATRDFGGGGGIALQCFAGYDLRWENGRLYTMESDGITIRRVDYQLTPPGATDDATRGYAVGSHWSMQSGELYTCEDNSAGAATWILTAFATAAQGEKADTALQPAAIASGTITPKSGDIDFNLLGGISGPTMEAVRTASWTATAGTLTPVNLADASGDVTVTLKASPTAGDVIGVHISTGHLTRRLLIDRNGQTINGSTAVGMWPLFQVGEYLIFRFDGSTWIVEDGRIPAKVKVIPHSNNTAVNGIVTTLGWSNVIYDSAGMQDTGTRENFTLRRDGRIRLRLNLTLLLTGQAVLADNTIWRMQFSVTNTALNTRLASSCENTGNGAPTGQNIAFILADTETIQLSAGAIYVPSIYQVNSAGQNLIAHAGIEASNCLLVEEVLR